MMPLETVFYISDIFLRIQNKEIKFVVSCFKGLLHYHISSITLCVCVCARMRVSVHVCRDVAVELPFVLMHPKPVDQPNVTQQQSWTHTCTNTLTLFVSWKDSSEIIHVICLSSSSSGIKSYRV